MLAATVEQRLMPTVRVKRVCSKGARSRDWRNESF
jgi:hypothetical protein